jgi:hypothetical protein
VDLALLLIGIATLVAALGALAFAWRGDRRDRDRADVVWQIDLVEEGVFRLMNIGADTAFDVTTQMWTEHEVAEVSARRLAHTESVEVALPRRAAGERPEDQPTFLGDLAPSRPGDPFWESMQKKREKWRANAKEQEVSVKVTWRSKNGRPDRWMGFTG